MIRSFLRLINGNNADDHLEQIIGIRMKNNFAAAGGRGEEDPGETQVARHHNYQHYRHRYRCHHHHRPYHHHRHHRHHRLQAVQTNCCWAACGEEVQTGEATTAATATGVQTATTAGDQTATGVQTATAAGGVQTTAATAEGGDMMTGLKLCAHIPGLTYLVTAYQ